MGQALAEGLGALEQFSLVALVDRRTPGDLFGAAHHSTLDEVTASDVDVVVDFSSPDGVAASTNWCVANGVALVVGTTGLTAEQRTALVGAGERVGVVVAANFSVGAVLAERFAAMAAPYFDGVEIIELHHDRKVDAPSGTSMAAAVTIAAARRRAGRAPLGDPTRHVAHEGARGADVDGGVRVHSVRLPGLVAHEEILFGSPGEGLRIRHDSYDRQSFVRGVALAINAIDSRPRLVEGISTLVP